MRLRRLGSVARGIGKGVVYAIALVLVLVGIGLTVLQTSWAKERIRALIVRQANDYLTATLQIGRLEGSLVRGLRLEDVRLTRGDQPIVSIDEIALSYSIRELWQDGTVIRRLRLTRPRIFIARDPDGRWNVAALVRRESRQQQRSGPRRVIEIMSIEIVDGDIAIGEPIAFGPAHIPTRFASLDTTFAFRYQPVASTLTFRHASWRGSAPTLDALNVTGTMSTGAEGWRFDRFAVQTPRSSFTLNGRVGGGRGLDLDVHADRFAFQEWAGIIHGLTNIAITGRFDARLHGPENRLATAIDLAGTGGSVKGQLTLDTSIPGWHGAGAVDIARLDLARWLNRPDKPSDITGHVAFDLDLDLGGHFPRGTYRFDGPHAAFMDYAADNVRAHGRLTATTVQIADATATAYGAAVEAQNGSTIGLDEPFPFRFVGTVAGIDLRRLPKAVPVPHVESRLTFAYDVTGRFANAYIAGRAQLDRSVFLGATIGAGTVGTIDTSTTPIHYSGEGGVEGFDVNRVGDGLDVAWMRDPRYAGEVSGHFRVESAGTDPDFTTLDASGRIWRASVFHGEVSDADVTLTIGRGTLASSFNGAFAQIDPSVPLADGRFAGSATGTANVRTTVKDLLVRTPQLADYDVEGTIALAGSTLHGFAIDRAHVTGSLRDSVGRLTSVEATGPALDGTGAGVVAFTGRDDSSFDYTIRRANLARVRDAIGADVAGTIATKGRLSGRWSALRVVGTGSAESLDADNVKALSSSLAYDVTIPDGDFARATARLDGSASFVTAFRQPVEHLNAIVTASNGRIGIDAKVQQGAGRGGSMLADVLLHSAEHRVDLVNLTLTIGPTPWQLARTGGQTPSVRWSDEGVAVDALTFVAGPSRDERIGVAGEWRRDGTGTLRATARHVFLDTLSGAMERPARYGGILDLDAALGGTADRPRVSADFTISNGRVRRVSYQKFAGRVEYADSAARIDVRLDQAAGVWLTAKGTVPRSLFDAGAANLPIDVAILSSPINLGLLEGVTDVVHNVSGTLRIDAAVVGTGRDPHFRGAVDLARAAFQVAATGSKYANGRAAIRLAPDRIDVESFHLEDSGGRALDLHGSLGTHERRVSDLQIDATARHFEVLRNEFGRVDVDATLGLRGRFEAPRVAGDITIDGTDVRVDNILERALFRPYATESAPAPAEMDPVAALNPWDRLGLDIALHVPNTLRLLGDNVQVSSGTPIGLGNINLRVAGDLYLYKDPAQPLFVTGSFDSVSGTYNFQGRQFDVDPSSSINFRGDLNPELFVSVTRNISGVLTRVTINGPLRQPELHLSSTPPLDASDILSLIVFNTTPNQLSSAQQQELAVRAGTLAAGFIATPIIAALQKEIGIDVLQLEPSGELGTGPKVTIGEEIAPGLVARFSRQFGSEPYDEATIEYYLSRILQLRATFSDAQSLESRSPFRRVERAGIDLIFFFSF